MIFWGTLKHSKKACFWPKKLLFWIFLGISHWVEGVFMKKHSPWISTDTLKEYRLNEDAPLLYVLKNRKSEMFKILMTIPSIDFSVLENQMDPFIVECLRQVPHLASRVATPECPVCYERFTRNDQVFQCNQGHFVCHRCHQRISNCPKCRGQIIGRAHDFEHFIQGLNI